MIPIEFIEKTLELLKKKYAFLQEENISFHIHSDRPNRNKGTNSHIKSIYNKESKVYFFEIHLNTSGQEEKSRTLKRRYDVFLNAQNLKLENEVSFIIKALHEIGHLHMFLTLMHTYDKDMRTIQNYMAMEKSALGILFTPDNDADAFLKGENLRYSFSMGELYADNFVLKNFIDIWNEVGLKKEVSLVPSIV